MISRRVCSRKVIVPGRKSGGDAGYIHLAISIIAGQGSEASRTPKASLHSNPFNKRYPHFLV